MAIGISVVETPMPTEEEAIDAIYASRGFITNAAKALDVSRWTLYKLIKKSERLQGAIVHAREQTKDFAEGQLLKNIKDGKEASLIFYLKTQASDRGYTEKDKVNLYVQQEIGQLLSKLEQNLEPYEYERILSIIAGEGNSSGTASQLTIEAKA